MLRELKESDIESYLVRCVEELGGEIRKVQWPGRRSAPDRVIMLPPEYNGDWQKDGTTIWVELKAPGVRPEDHQIREHNRMRRVGQRVVVIDSFEGVDGLLK